jgi:predicted ATPase/DNA-binding XRE family transcriptional regulator
VAAGFTQEELATIAGLSVHAVSALERGRRRRPHPETVRALATALDLAAPVRDELLQAAREPTGGAPIEYSEMPLLPHAATPLVGRDADLRALRLWVANPAFRILTLVGTGGVGKTRLLLEVAREVADAARMRVVFVGLAAIRDAAFVPSAIAEAFGVTDGIPADLPRRVRAACDGRPTLLLLDNCEHVLDAIPLVAALVSGVASLRVLATSRAPLRVRGEREYAVGPLGMEADPNAATFDRPAPAPAIRLFVDRVHDFNPDFQLSDVNEPGIAAICRRLDALPLAIELAAPWLKVLSQDDLLRRLNQDVLSPSIGRRDLPERQQTMNATIAWSYQLLAVDDQRVFRRLGAFPNGFPIEAAAAVCSDIEIGSSPLDGAQRAVAGLIERSLLLRAESSDVGRPLYFMLETVRAYATTQLVMSGERDAAMDGLARYCLAAARTASDRVTGPAQGEWLDRVRDDLESFRSALTWLIERGRSADACDIVWDLLLFWLIRGHTAEGLHWYDELAATPSLSSPARATALAGAAVMNYAQGDVARARHVAELSLSLSTGSSTPAVAFSENILGYVDLGVGNIAAARGRFESAAARFHDLGKPWGAGNALAGQGWAALAGGALEESDRLLNEAAAVLSTVGPWFSALVLYVRGVLAVRRGAPTEAIGFVRESLLGIQRLHDRFALIYTLVPLAAAAELIGDDEWAARILAARDAVTERTGAVVVDESVRDLRERVERDARARLGQKRWAREYEAGRNASVESLLREIDDHCRKLMPAGT